MRKARYNLEPDATDALSAGAYSESVEEIKKTGP
jgi:hypothetical protein